MTSAQLTLKEAAALLRLSPGSVYQLCATRKLRHRRVGPNGRGKILIPADAIEEYLAQATVGVEEAAESAPPLPSRPKAAPAFKHIRVN